MCEGRVVIRTCIIDEIAIPRLVMWMTCVRRCCRLDARVRHARVPTFVANDIAALPPWLHCLVDNKFAAKVFEVSDDLGVMFIVTGAIVGMLAWGPQRQGVRGVQTMVKTVGGRLITLL